MLGAARVLRCPFITVPSGLRWRLAWLDRRRAVSCSAKAMRDAALSASCLCVLSLAVHSRRGLQPLVHRQSLESALTC